MAERQRTGDNADKRESGQLWGIGVAMVEACVEAREW